MELRIWLPMPPTLNNMFATNFATKRRFKSKAYGEWIAEAQIALAQQHPVFPVRGKIRVFYELGRLKGRADIANREKALSDFLVAQELIDDDSKIEDLRMVWLDGFAGARVTVSSVDE